MLRLQRVPSKQTSTFTSSLVALPIHGHEPGGKAVGGGGGTAGGGVDGGELVQQPSHALELRQPRICMSCFNSEQGGRSAEHNIEDPSSRSHELSHEATESGADGAGIAEI